MPKKVIVAGGGAAGMMAAGTAGKRRLDVALVEKNDRLGKKILISGKGRCNITNNTDIQGLIDNTPGNGHFLYSTFYTFSNADLISFFNGLGLETKIERGGRVFPVSDRSSDVVEILKKYLKIHNVNILLKSPVKEVTVDNGKVTGIVLANGREMPCDSLILALGGASYPGTGSSGDGYEIARRLGHTIIDIRPSLVPLESEDGWVRELQGLSLKNVAVRFTNKSGRKIYDDFGEMLFTHFGVSGPVILSAGRHLLDDGYNGITLHMDLKPALDEEKLDSRLQRDFEKYSRKQFKNALDDLLPQKLIPVIIELSQISGDKPVNQITRDERKRLVRLLKGLKAGIKGPGPVEEAIVTAGGVHTDEINPSTMESKIIKGLFFAGELIDVDAYTGGFNLTIAFATGYTAGMNC